MKKPAKIALAVASIWPFVWMLIFILFFFGMIFFVSSHSEMSDEHRGMPLPIMLLFAGHIFTILFIFALTAFYVVYLFKTDRVPQDKKALWAVVLFFANIFAFPIFWYLYIWKEPAAITGG
jgi:hypothetical protein